MLYPSHWGDLYDDQRRTTCGWEVAHRIRQSDGKLLWSGTI